MLKLKLAEKIIRSSQSTLPFFKPAKNRNLDMPFNLTEAIATISRNRERIPERYWEGTRLNICKETVRLERGGDLVTEFTMEGKKGDICRLKVHSFQYEDIHECNGQEFGEFITQLRLDAHAREILSELYILTKDDLTIPDLIHCNNMEIRRDAIKKMGYEKVRKYGTVIDTFDEYELIDVRHQSVDFGRYLKMIDSTSKEVYLLKVPRSRDFGTIKIPMNKATQALAWSFKKQEHEYRPEVET